MVNIGLDEIQVLVFVLQQLRLLQCGQQEVEHLQRLVDKVLAVLESLLSLVFLGQLVQVLQSLENQLLVDNAEDVVSVH